jgi:hypothetical protein
MFKNILILIILTTAFRSYGLNEIQNPHIPGDSAAEHDSTLQTIKALHGLFIAGSVLAGIGLGGIVVSGTSSSAKTLGTVLFALGQAGLVMCGVSTSLAKKAILARTGDKKEYYWEPGSGWMTFGASYACFGGGIAGIALGIDNDNGILVIGGIGLLGLGEILQIVSWKRFCDGQAFWRRQCPGLTINPILSIDKKGFASTGLQADLVF